MIKLLLIFALVLPPAFFPGASRAQPPAGVAERDAVPRFGTAEIVLPYQKASGWNRTNPFTDVDLSARVTSPSGRTFDVAGFFDGDGAAGRSGWVFKIRVAAEEEGWWSWTASSNLPELDGRQGGFLCAGRLDGAFGSGPITIDPDHPRSFRHADGKPVYLIGKFLDEDAPPSLRYSHTLLSELLDDEIRQRMLSRHLAMKLNKMNIYLFNRGDYGAISTTPWPTGWWSDDPRRFDLERWRMYERWITTLRDAGMVAHLWFFADDSYVRDMPHEDRKRLIAYAMARLSAYSNTLFTLALEWQEDWQPAEVDEHAEFLQSRNPWKRLVSVHGQTGDVTFPDASWADFMQVQAGNGSDPATVHALGLRARARAEKPLIQEEHGRGKEDARNRRNAWAALTSGAAGSGTGAFLAVLSDFVRSIPFERMRPAQELVLDGTAYALAEPGLAYVFYLPEGGTVQADLRGSSGEPEMQWFNPRNGDTVPIPRAGIAGIGKGTPVLPAPGPEDWVLYVHYNSNPSLSE